ncbi:MAG TPA: hypothetical protein DDZ40_00535 [Deltaproteobacteria bacterium]|nr:hypothetical protein [Deltaproteobacteria bacterium]
MRPGFTGATHNASADYAISASVMVDTIPIKVFFFIMFLLVSWGRHPGSMADPFRTDYKEGDWSILEKTINSEGVSWAPGHY